MFACRAYLWEQANYVPRTSAHPRHLCIRKMAGLITVEVCNRMLSSHKRDRALEIKRNILLDIGRLEELNTNLGSSTELCEKILRKLMNKNVLSTTENDIVQESFNIVSTEIRSLPALHQFYCELLYKSKAEWKTQLDRLLDNADGTFSFNSWVFEKLLEQLCIDYFMCASFSRPVALLSWCDATAFEKQSDLLALFNSLSADAMNAAWKYAEALPASLVNKHPISLVCCRLYESFENWDKVLTMLSSFVSDKEVTLRINWMKVRALSEKEDLQSAVGYFDENSLVFANEFLLEWARVHFVAAQNEAWRSGVPDNKIDLLRVFEPFQSNCWALLAESYSARGNLQAAVSAYQHVLTLDPHSDYAILLLQILCRLRKDEDALEQCLRFKERRDISSHALLTINILEAQTNDTREEERISHINRALLNYGTVGCSGVNHCSGKAAAERNEDTPAIFNIPKEIRQKIMLNDYDAARRLTRACPLLESEKAEVEIVSISLVQLRDNLMDVYLNDLFTETLPIDLGLLEQHIRQEKLIECITLSNWNVNGALLTSLGTGLRVVGSIMFHRCTFDRTSTAHLLRIAVNRVNRLCIVESSEFARLLNWEALVCELDLYNNVANGDTLPISTEMMNVDICIPFFSLSSFDIPQFSVITILSWIRTAVVHQQRELKWNFGTLLEDVNLHTLEGLFTEVYDLDDQVIHEYNNGLVLISHELYKWDVQVVLFSLQGTV